MFGQRLRKGLQEDNAALPQEAYMNLHKANWPRIYSFAREAGQEEACQRLEAWDDFVDSFCVLAVEDIEQALASGIACAALGHLPLPDCKSHVGGCWRRPDYGDRMKPKADQRPFPEQRPCRSTPGDSRPRRR